MRQIHVLRAGFAARGPCVRSNQQGRLLWWGSFAEERPLPPASPTSVGADPHLKRWVGGTSGRRQQRAEGVSSRGALPRVRRCSPSRAAARALVVASAVDVFARVVGAAARRGL